MKPSDYVKLAHNLTDAEKESYIEFIQRHGTVPDITREDIETDLVLHPSDRNLVAFHDGKAIGHSGYSPGSVEQMMEVWNRRSFASRYGRGHTPGLELLLHAKEIDSLRTFMISELTDTGKKLFDRLEHEGIVKLRRLSPTEQNNARGQPRWEASFTAIGVQMKPKLPLRER